VEEGERFSVDLLGVGRRVLRADRDGGHVGSSVNGSVPKLADITVAG
jgi:hypothetical protein